MRTPTMPTPTPIDLIDRRGDIREHLTVNGQWTVCGRSIGLRQTASGNRKCGRCYPATKTAA